MTNYKKLLLVSSALLVSVLAKAQENTFIESKKDTMSFVQIIQDPNINTINSLYISSRDENIIKEGHKIQIYYGDRDIAEGRKEKFSGLYPDIPCEVIYEAPYFKTLVGSYLTKLDADRELELIRANFKSAFIIKKEIKL